MALVFVLVALAVCMALFVDTKGAIATIVQALLILSLCTIAALVYLREKGLI